MNKIFAKKSIDSGQSLGSILKEKRKEKKVSLAKAETKTKIRYKYLLALEEDDYKNMPPDVYNLGFLTRYCEYLGLDPKKYIKLYTDEKKVQENLSKKFFSFNEKKGLINPGHPDKFKNKLKFVVTPQIFITTMVVFLVVGILGYIWFQVKSFAAAPPLEVSNPNEQIVVSNDHIEVSGNTDPTVELSINGRAVGVDESGQFSQNVELIDGINTVEIKAQNKANKETKKNIKVLVVNEEDK